MNNVFVLEEYYIIHLQNTHLKCQFKYGKINSIYKGKCLSLYSAGLHNQMNFMLLFLLHTKTI